MHEHVHVGGAGVQLLGAQEVEDGGEQGGVPVDENLQDERKDEKSAWSGRQSVRKKKSFQQALTAPVSSFRVEIRPLSRLETQTFSC